jgi:hypothetical protein
MPTTKGRVLTWTYRAKLYVKRFLTEWIAPDPDPGYSNLDKDDGLGQKDGA